MDAGLLRCPSCGAPASTDLPKCSHCGCQLATVACPKCFNRIFRDSKFCPACGTAAVQWTGRNGTLQCPECSRAMLRGEIGSCALDHCGACLGVWLDTESFNRICSDADQQTAMLGAPQILGDPSRPPDIAVRYRKCPRCADIMHRINFAHCSGVVVDVCRAHGTWFDHAELHRIIEFVRAGGMERSRAVELDHLDRERRRLEQLRRDGASPPFPTTTGGMIPGDLTDSILWTAIRAAGWLLESFLKR